MAAKKKSSPAKKTTSKKSAPAKKSGPPKKAAKKKAANAPARSAPQNGKIQAIIQAGPISRRSTNRSSVVEGKAGIAPPGPLTQALLDRQVEAMRKKANKRTSDFVSYPKLAMMKDADEMLEGVEDLPLFAEAETPIGKPDFEWMQLLRDNVELTEDDVIRKDIDTERVSEDEIIAMRAVVDARKPLGKRAQASGIPLLGFSFEGKYDDPDSMFTVGCRVCRVARERLDEFVGRDHTLGLIEDLEEKLGVLKGCIDRRKGIKKRSTDDMTRKDALLRMLFDNLTYVGAWGQDIALGDETKEARYALDNIFPKEKSDPKPPPTT